MSTAMKPDLRDTLRPIYEELEVIIKNLSNTNLEGFTANPFKGCIIAALAKSCEFNIDTNNINSEKYSFYLTCFLRGMCEDLIALKCILKLPAIDRDSVINSYNAILVSESLHSQKKFFDDEKSIFPVLGPNSFNFDIPVLEAKLKAAWSSLGYADKIFPSVNSMAVNSGLQVIYDFLYHATSRTVHFSPNLLMRMAWYNKKTEKLTVTTSNFKEYYAAFNTFYGSYLFIKFAKTFSKELSLGKDFKQLIKKLEDNTDKVYTYPEIITYEEMNMKRPGTITRILARSLENIQTGDSTG